MQLTKDFVVPENRLGILLSDAQKINEELGDREFGSELLSKKLGYDKRTTNFYKKLADLNRYALLEGKGKTMRVSELAKQAFGEDEDRIDALQEIFKKVPLWEILQNHLAEAASMYDFARTLENTTGQTFKNEVVEWVRNAYLSDIRALKRYSKVGVKQEELPQSLSSETNVRETADSKAMVMRFEPLGSGQMVVEIKGVFSEKLARRLQQAFIEGTNN